MARRSATATVLALVLLACASAGQDRQRHDRNVITAEELAQVAASDLYDAIQRLRPHFLVPRGHTTLMTPDTAIRVYVDGTRYGGIADLRTLSVRGATEVRFIGPREATTRWGTGHSLGVIHVTTRTP